jgi:hypothetical protein
LSDNLKGKGEERKREKKMKECFLGQVGRKD